MLLTNKKSFFGYADNLLFDKFSRIKAPSLFNPDKRNSAVKPISPSRSEGLLLYEDRDFVLLKLPSHPSEDSEERAKLARGSGCGNQIEEEVKD